MECLILKAEASISDLNKLEEHLRSIDEVVSREGLSISSAKSELLAQLSTILGGNRDQLREMDENLALLKGVGEYRDRALAHLVAVSQKLWSMVEDMDELRIHPVAPDLVDDGIHCACEISQGLPEGVEGATDDACDSVVVSE
jgi:hypothetical protein